MTTDLNRSDQDTKPLEIKTKSFFAGWPFIVFMAAISVFAFHACTHMVAAGDTWVAMACGRHHSNHGVDTVEPFSANSHDPGPTRESISKWPGWAQGIVEHFELKTIRKWHPTGWINQNWLTHTTFFKLAKTFGGQGEYEYNYNALIFWKFAIFFIEAFCIYFFARLIGVSIPSSAAASAAAMFIGRSFFDVRPACYANVLAVLLLLIMALSIYRNYRYIWLIVPLTVFWANVHGGYVYVFMMMFPYIGFNFVCIPFQNRFYSVGLKGVYHAIGAGFASFFAMVLFNPFHLTNLTHTFEVSISEHAESWRSVNEWHSAFEFSNPVGNSYPFLYMFILMWIALIVWSFARFLKPKAQTRSRRKSKRNKIPGLDQWPKTDLSILFIAGLSVYMAVESRRFIPIAASAACPVIFLMLEQTVWMVSSKINFLKKGKVQMSPLPAAFKCGVVMFAAAMTLFFGIFWGAKFKRIYLDPWPNEAVRDSVFMRMTASNVKPFEVCKFMRDNKLSGRMFNYWTEGGAIAFGQDPDPETGRTPLQLFMDGRAQAAYDHSKFQLWRYLYAGGPTAQKVRQAGRIPKPDSAEMKKIGDFLTEQMTQRDIWVFVLPTSQFQRKNDPLRINYFPQALPVHPDWLLAYMDDHQQMYVNKKMPKGKELIENVINDKAKFPNEYSRNLTLSRLKLRMRNPLKINEGFEHAKKAFELNPSQAAMVQLTYESGRWPRLKKKAEKYVQEYVDDFIENKEAESKKGGYAKKLEAAYVGATYLSRIHKRDKELSKKYSAYSSKFSKERRDIALAYKW